MAENILKANDLKATKRRQVVLSILENSLELLTAEEIYLQSIKKTSMSVSTTYRTLASLTDKGIILKNHSQNGKTYYQINSNHHKHRLICSSCHEVIPIARCPIEDLETQLAASTGYIITGHSLEFSGICPKCSQAKQE
jgi:Fur family ferric uptake transcriptional regulator